MRAILPRVCAALYGAWALSVLVQVVDVVSLIADMPSMMGDLIANLALTAWYLGLCGITVLTILFWVPLERFAWALGIVVVLSSVTEAGRAIFFLWSGDAGEPYHWLGACAWVLASLCAREIWRHRHRAGTAG